MTSSIVELDPWTGEAVPIPVVTWTITQLVAYELPDEVAEMVVKRLLDTVPSLDDGFRDLGNTKVIREDDFPRNCALFRLTAPCARLPWDNAAERQVAKDCGYGWRT